MERVYAFTDEYGSFGWDFDKKDVSSVVVISAIIVKESNLTLLRSQVEQLRVKFFQEGQIKSSKISNNHIRRKKIIAAFLPLNFTIFSVVFDKKHIKDYLGKEMPGLNFKPSFYKFMNNIVHKELRNAFNTLTIVADRIGSSDYMVSFSRYVEKQQDIPNLFGEAEFFFENSKNEVLVQLADLISGTLGHFYDTNKKTEDTPNYYKILQKKIARIEKYPKDFDSFIVEDSPLTQKYDKEIASLCFNQAVKFINANEENEDAESIARVATTKYLLFRFMNNDLDKYIPTSILKNNISTTKMGKISTHMFRTRIIAKLRDNGVILASSKLGYKIPSHQSELFDFINTYSSIIIPMLGRLKICRDTVKLMTHNKLDLFEHSEYRALRKYFDDNPIQLKK